MAINAQRVPVLAGTPPTFAAPASSDTVTLGSVLIVKNGSASAVTVTLATPGNLPTGDAYPDKAYTVAAGAEAWIPVLADYLDPNTLRAGVSFSSTASVTVAAIVF
jgi:hypothetical protein